MAVTINLRNNTSFFMTVSGIEGVIAPNSNIEDKTIQWISNENKTIKVFSTSACTIPAICSGTLTFQPNVGIFVERGPISGTQSVRLEADVYHTLNQLTQSDNDSGGKLIDWSDIDEANEINLSFFDN